MVGWSVTTKAMAKHNNQKPSGLKKGEKLVLCTESGLASGGEAIGRAPDGRVVFIRGAAPDERVRVQLTHVSKRFLRGDNIEVLNPSASRVTSPCLHSEQCGGCPLMFIEPERLKHEKVKAGLQTLERLGGLSGELALRRPPLSLSGIGFRTRARFVVSGANVGFREAASHEVAPIDTCLAVHPLIEATRKKVETALKNGRLNPRAALEISMVTNGHDVSLHISECSEELESCLADDPRIVFDKVLTVQDYAGCLYLHPAVFCQASHDGNYALLEEVAQSLTSQGELALELYAGSGNFTRLLSTRFKEVVSVELGAKAVALGKKLNLPGVRWFAAPASTRYLGDRTPDVVLVNPPRVGVETPVMEELIALKPPAMVYVSCNVGSLARDIKALQTAGLAISSVAVFDIYPSTPHLEWVVCLRAARSDCFATR